MKIFIKQISGKTISLEVEQDANIVDVAMMAYENRSESQMAATLDNYARSVNLMHSWRTLDYGKKLSDYGIVNESTLSEIGKSFTMSPGFDWSSLSIEDPISLE